MTQLKILLIAVLVVVAFQPPKVLAQAQPGQPTTGLEVFAISSAEEMLDLEAKALAGDPVAMSNYGVMLRRGDNRSRVRTDYWTKKAAKAGHEPAINDLKRRGVPLD